MNLSHSSDIQISDYDLLRKFYGRDLGGEQYFNWKHREDTPLNGNKRVIRSDVYGEKIGLIFSTQYHFSYNHNPLTINLIGDLGVDDRIKSSVLVKRLLLSAHCFKADASLCFSDDRKIAIYSTIFQRNLNTSNQIIAYDDTVIKTRCTNEEFTLCSLDNIDFNKFKNNFGRIKDGSYISYLKKHPCYHDIFAIQHNNQFAIFGKKTDFIELLDISDTSDSHFYWAIRASSYFHSCCKILLPRSLSLAICHETGVLQEKKPLNLMVSWYASASQRLDTDNTWICRLDRR